jgi:hypothetical protein
MREGNRRPKRIVCSLPRSAPLSDRETEAIAKYREIDNIRSPRFDGHGDEVVFGSGNIPPVKYIAWRRHNLGVSDL